MDMKWDTTNEARSADLISSKPEKNNCFIKNTTTHEWESEQKKVRERIAALEETERKESFSSKLNQQKGRKNLSIV